MDDIIKKYKKIFEQEDFKTDYDPNRRGYDSINSLGSFGQNQEILNDKNVFDYRKSLEKNLSVNLDDKNRIDVVYTKSDFNNKKEIYDKISQWLYEKNLLNVNNLSEGLEKLYYFVLNNSQEIYEVFGKSLNDEERKLVVLKALKILDERLKDEKIDGMIISGDSDLLEFSLNTGIRIDEAYHKILERAPKNPKAERFIKKSKEEFKKRYGDRWKEVLYATAWKKFGESEEKVKMKNDDLGDHINDEEEQKVKENRKSLIHYNRKGGRNSTYLKIRKMKKILKSLFKNRR